MSIFDQKRSLERSAMPQFQLEADQIEDIMAYLKTLNQ
jgi:hypothetical protein